MSHYVAFGFPVRELENDRIKLTPFIPDQHAELFFQGALHHPELYQHVPSGPYLSCAALTEDLREGAPPSGYVLFAVLDKTRAPSTNAGHGAPPVAASPATFAGVVQYFDASPEHLRAEIGIFVLPPFQRTHVATHAVGLLLRYALDLPSASTPGLGLRRVQWQTSDKNVASIALAERMGFLREGLRRWEKVFPSDEGKVGNGVAVRECDPRPGTLGRHTVVLGICWDDWESGGREHVARLMER